MADAAEVAPPISPAATACLKKWRAPPERQSGVRRMLWSPLSLTSCRVVACFSRCRRAELPPPG
jgi:hypothetical protein